MIPAWAAKYIGVPFKDHGRDLNGFDCWGLVSFILREERGLLLPDFGGQYRDTRDRDGIEIVIRAEAEQWTRVATPMVEDVVVFNIGGRPLHCGLVVEPGQMLHAQSGTGCCIEGYRRPKWASRIEGFYHHGLATDCTSDPHGPSGSLRR